MRRFLFVAVSLLAVTSLYAREVGSVVNAPEGRQYSDRMEKTWYFTFGAGPQYYRGENEWKAPVGRTIAPVLDLTIGKWLIPGIGIDFNLSYAGFKGLWMLTGEQQVLISQGFDQDKVITQSFRKWDRADVDRPGEDLLEQRGSYMNTYFRILFDIRSLVLGYDKARLWSVSPYLGGGWIFGFGENTGRATAPSLNMGLLNQFRLNDSWALYVNPRMALVGENFDGEYTNDNNSDSYFGITFGATFSFGKSKAAPAPVLTPVPVLDATALSACRDELEQLRRQQAADADRMAALEAENKALMDKLKDFKNLKDTITATRYMPVKYVVTFPRRDVVTNREKINIDLLANYIKLTDGRVFHVCGYADKQTGTKDINDWVSELRANTIARMLIEKGVNPDQLVIEFRGGVNSMFYDESLLSRCAIIVGEDKTVEETAAEQVPAN